MSICSLCGKHFDSSKDCGCGERWRRDNPEFDLLATPKKRGRIRQIFLCLINFVPLIIAVVRDAEEEAIKDEYEKHC